MAQSTLNIVAPSPVVTGGILYAPSGTALPTDETTALNVAFKALGYVGEGGITPAGEAASQSDIKAWGGDIVASIEESKSIERYTFTLLEYFGEETNKLIYGTGNVVVTAATSTVGTKLAIKSKGDSPAAAVWAFDMAYKGKKMRYVAPNGQLAVLNELPLVHSDVAGYECQLTCLPDASGVRTYRYLANTLA